MENEEKIKGDDVAQDERKDGEEDVVLVAIKEKKKISFLGALANRASPYLYSAKERAEPYLTTAAAASTEAARYTAEKAKDYVSKKIGSSGREVGEESESVSDWSEVGTRYVSLTWYEKKLVRDADKWQDGPVALPVELNESRITEPFYEEEFDMPPPGPDERDAISENVPGGPPLPTPPLPAGQPPPRGSDTSPAGGAAMNGQMKYPPLPPLPPLPLLPAVPLPKSSASSSTIIRDDTTLNGDVSETTTRNGTPLPPLPPLSPRPPLPLRSAPSKATECIDGSIEDFQDHDDDDHEDEQGAFIVSAPSTPPPLAIAVESTTSPPLPQQQQQQQPQQPPIQHAFIMPAVTASMLGAASPLPISTSTSTSMSAAADSKVKAGEGVNDKNVDVVVVVDDDEKLTNEWLKQAANEGDEEAEYHLTKLFCPPSLDTIATTCFKCNQPFGLTRYRHHCRHCGHAFCHQHSWHRHAIPKYGLYQSHRVCVPCKKQLELEDWRDRIAWRFARLDDYLAESEDRLIPYFEVDVDTGYDKAWRCVDGAVYVARRAPLSTAVSVSVEVMDVLVKHGMKGVAGLVLRQEIWEAVEMLRQATAVDESWPVSAHELTAAMYYLLAHEKGERGNHPEREQQQHAETEGCDVATDEELASLIELAALPLHFVYDKPPVEIQICASLLGWELLFTKNAAQTTNVHQPAFALFTRRDTMCAALVVRGTSSVEDVVTDLKAVPVPFPPQDDGEDDRGGGGSGGDRDKFDKLMFEGGWKNIDPLVTLASCGIARAAEWLQREVEPVLVKLRDTGHSIYILGHSLGGGVAALLGALIRSVIPDVRIITFAAPACADLKLATSMEDICTSVVLHDDLIPRLSPITIRLLLKELLTEKESWVGHLEQDWDAVVGRAKGFWAPRFRTNRGMNSIESGRRRWNSEAEKSCNSEDTTNGSSGMVEMKEQGSGLSNSGGGGGSGDKGKAKALDTSGYRAVDVGAVTQRLSQYVDVTSEAIRKKVVGSDKYKGVVVPVDKSKQGLPLAVDAAAGGGSDVCSSGVTDNADVSDGLESSSGGGVVVGGGDDDTTSVMTVPTTPLTTIHDHADGGGGDSGGAVGALASAIAGAGAVAGGDASDAKTAGLTAGLIEEMEEVEAVELVEMHVPGKLLHIYSHYGTYQMCRVPRNYASLRRIEMYANMLTDHSAASYFEALMEVRDVRLARQQGREPVPWIPFTASDVCMCCGSDFAWHSTARSKAQQNRDKHNCHACGRLVCDPCSKNTRAIPSIGLSSPCRVCDRCFYGGFTMVPPTAAK